MKISIEQLRKIMPGCSYAKATQMISFLNAAMEEFAINSFLRQSAFLAQLAHESGQLKYMEEIASGSAYEGRKDLGNTHKGDGKLFKGRGPIQLTGRANYKKFGDILGLDFISNPEQVATHQVGFRVAGLFWKLNGLNKLADEENFKLITKRINGGYNGLAERQAFYAKAKAVLASVDFTNQTSLPPDPSAASSASNSSNHPVTVPETQPEPSNEQVKVEKLSTSTTQDLIKLPKVSPSLKSQVVGYWHQLLGAGITIGGLVEFAHDHVTLIICVVVGLIVVGFGLWYLNRSMNRAAEQTQKNQDIVASSDLNNAVVTGKE